MLLADNMVDIQTVMMVATPIMVALTGAVVFMFRQVVSTKDAQIAQIVSTKDAQIFSLKEMYEGRLLDANNREKTGLQLANQAVSNLELAANQKRENEGKPPMPPMAPVVPFSHSPVTEEQQKAADLATLEARAVAAAKALGLPPREPSAPETAEDREIRLTKEQREKVAGKPSAS